MKRLICCKVCHVTKDGKEFSPIRTSDRGIMYFQTCDTCFDAIPDEVLLQQERTRKKTERQRRWREAKKAAKSNIRSNQAPWTSTLGYPTGTPLVDA